MDAAIKTKIQQRLASLGYTLTNDDDFALGLTYDKVVAHICHACNISAIPSCIEPETIDATCGEFLAGKKATGQLTGVEFESITKAITEGDVKVEFATGNSGAEDNFDAYMSKLAKVDTEAILAHRKLVW